MNYLEISLVIYKTSIDKLRLVVDPISKPIGNWSIKINIFDNGISKGLEEYCLSNNYNYSSLSKNIGFGKGHNFNFNKIDKKNFLFLILNPDVFFDSNDFIALLKFIEQNQDFGIMSPKLLNSDCSVQQICRPLPTPLNLFVRRLSKKLGRSNFFGNSLGNISNELTVVPFIHGACFFVKSEIFRRVGGFDSRFFLYMEDADLCRRVNEISTVLYNSKFHAIHEHQQGSYKNFILLYHHSLSAIRYFNKWGWFFGNIAK